MYNSGGYGISMGDLAALVQRFLPDAQVRFAQERGGRDSSPIWLMDNSRWVDEYDYPLPLFEHRVLEMINEVRQDAGLPLLEVSRV